MRITQNVTYNTYVNDIMSKQESLNGLNAQLSSGKRVNIPSDDPVSAGEILTSRSMLADFTQYGQNIDSGLSYLNSAETALDSVQNVLTTLRETAASGASGTMDANGRKTLATTVSSLFNQLISLGNTGFNNKYIFSGFKTGTTAFDPTGTYLGDTNKFAIKIGTGTAMTIGVNGNEVFKGIVGGVQTGVDIYQTVTNLETALNNNDSTGINNATGGLETAYNQVSDAIASIGANVSRLNSTKSDINNTKLSIQSNISNLQDLDYTKAVSDFQFGQMALQAAMEASGKVFSLDIFNYI